MDIPGGVAQLLERIIEHIVDNNIRFELLPAELQNFVRCFFAVVGDDPVNYEEIARQVSRQILYQGARLIGVHLQPTPPPTPKKTYLKGDKSKPKVKVSNANKFIKKHYQHTTTEEQEEMPYALRSKQQGEHASIELDRDQYQSIDFEDPDFHNDATTQDSPVTQDDTLNEMDDPDFEPIRAPNGPEYKVLMPRKTIQ